MSGNQLDISSDGPPARGAASAPNAQGKFLGIRFDCCGVYARIYPNRAGNAYEGRCPKCLRAVQIGIGPGGSSTRFFTAS